MTTNKFMTLFFALMATVLISSTVQAKTPDPILFVHGYLSSASVWNPMKARFQNDQWPSTHLASFSYDFNQANATTADQVAMEVDKLIKATGATKVDIIAHSMGSLSSRYYLKNLLIDDSRVDSWVSLGGPNHGTDFAYGCFSYSCFEMRMRSSFLTALNAGDESPGKIRYATFRSPCDNVINPDSSVIVKGASNFETHCVSHNGLLDDNTVYNDVRDFVNR
ncbi:MAG: triacylglycerol lipase [Bermanella sp.]